jgi:hypothetical protein
MTWKRRDEEEDRLLWAVAISSLSYKILSSATEHSDGKVLLSRSRFGHWP